MNHTPKISVAFVAGSFVGLAATLGLRRLGHIRRVDRQFRIPLLYAPLPPLRKLLLAPIRLLTGNYRPDPVLPGHIRRTNYTVEATGADPRIEILAFEREDRPANTPAFVWIHGGGLVAGNKKADSDFLARIASELNILVLSIGYRLAPEHTYPAAIDDCHAALQWISREHKALSIDRTRIAIGGTSAGGGLAAALAQRTCDESDLKPVLQLLVYPMLDDRTSLRDGHDGRGELLWTAGHNLAGWTSYLGHTPHPERCAPYAAAARREDCSGLPPAWIGVGTLDLFYAEDVEYAERLRAAGVPCQLEVVPDAYHGFDVVAKDAPSSIAFTASMVDALRRALFA